MYRSRALTLEKSRGAVQSLKKLWLIRPPPKGLITWFGGSGTSESHLSATVSSGRLEDVCEFNKLHDRVHSMFVLKTGKYFWNTRYWHIWRSRMSFCISKDIV